MAQLRSFLKRECGGATAWVLSGNRELTRHLRMKAASKLRIENAGTSLALISYEVLASRPPPAEAAVQPPPSETAAQPPAAEAAARPPPPAEALQHGAAAEAALAPPPEEAFPKPQADGAADGEAREASARPKRASDGRIARVAASTPAKADAPSFTDADATDGDLESLFSNLYQS